MRNGGTRSASGPRDELRHHLELSTEVVIFAVEDRVEIHAAGIHDPQTQTRFRTGGTVDRQPIDIQLRGGGFVEPGRKKSLQVFARI